MTSVKVDGFQLAIDTLKLTGRALFLLFWPLISAVIGKLRGR